MATTITQTPVPKTTTDDAISIFYRLKDNYESDYSTRYLNSIVKSNKSSKKKRADFAKLPKPACVNCKRNVGTTFTVEYLPEEDSRHFIAKCGDTREPCPLNIDFVVGPAYQYDTVIHMQAESLNDVKTAIIKNKNDLVFQFMDYKTAMDIYNGLNEELKTITSFIGFLNEKNVLINNNPAKLDLLKKQQVQLGEFNYQFGNLVEQYVETGEGSYLTTAVRAYVDELQPLLKNIRNLSYDVYYMMWDEVANKRKSDMSASKKAQEISEQEPNYNQGGAYRLMIRPTSLKNGEINFESDNRMTSLIYDTGPLITQAAAKAKVNKNNKTKNSASKVKKNSAPLINVSTTAKTVKVYKGGEGITVTLSDPNRNKTRKLHQRIVIEADDEE